MTNPRKAKKTIKKSPQDVNEEGNPNFIVVTNAYIVSVSTMSQSTGIPASVPVAKIAEGGLFPFELQYKISRRLGVCRQEALIYDEARKNIAKKFSIKEDSVEGEEGKPKTDENGNFELPKEGTQERTDFIAELNELMIQEVEIPLPPIKLDKFIENKAMANVGDDVMTVLLPLCEDIDEG